MTIEPNKIQSNQKRCPFLKITKKIVSKDKESGSYEEITTVELNDCYESFCSAYSLEKKCCSYFIPNQYINPPDPEDEDEQ